MNKIKTIENGFSFNEIDYTFQDQETESGFVSSKIISDSQLLIGTNEGFILLDLSCSIDDVIFTDINKFFTALINE
jgi:hypothetical protein